MGEVRSWGGRLTRRGETMNQTRCAKSPCNKRVLREEKLGKVPSVHPNWEANRRESKNNDQRFGQARGVAPGRTLFKRIGKNGVNLVRNHKGAGGK